MCVGALVVGQSAFADDATLDKALVTLGAGRINDLFQSIEESIEAVGEEWRRVHLEKLPAEPEDYWKARMILDGETAIFRSWQDLESTPGYKFPYPALCSYNGDELDEGVRRTATELEALVPVIRAAYNSFDFSWVYCTTPNELFLIYPYLTMEEAVYNNPPTEQEFYSAANFEERSVGWTLPYLDLVGDGMMVTASFPVFDGDELLGVASRDITLDELADDVLGELANGANAITYIVDAQGLAIDASDPKIEKEIVSVNTEAKAPVLYFRTEENINEITDLPDGVQVSSFSLINTVTESVLLWFSPEGKAEVSSLMYDKEEAFTILASPIEATGWILIMIQIEEPEELPPADAE